MVVKEMEGGRLRVVVDNNSIIKQRRRWKERL